jgi:hypothetical protein
VKGSDRGPGWDAALPRFAWRNEGKPRETSIRIACVPEGIVTGISRMQVRNIPAWDSFLSGLGSVPEYSIWNSYWTQWQRDKVSCKYCGSLCLWAIPACHLLSCTARQSYRFNTTSVPNEKFTSGCSPGCIQSINKNFNSLDSVVGVG